MHFNTGKIRSGDKAKRKPTPRELEWAAGFYEGEGTVSCGDDTSFQTSIVQNNVEPLRKWYKLFGGKRPYLYRPAKGTRKDCWAWRASGVRARGVVLTLYALLSKRRQKQIRRAFLPYHKRRKRIP